MCDHFGGMGMQGDNTQLELLYPLYLDVPMMISFLASLQDGVTYEENIHRKTGKSQSASAEVSGSVGLPSLLGLLPFDLRGRLTGNIGVDDSEELQLVKRHTEASLFNKLRSTLYDIGMVRSLEESWGNEELLVAGDIVEFTGTVSRNPLEELLTIIDRVKIFLEPTGSPSKPQSRQNRKGGRGSSTNLGRTEEGISEQSSQPDILTIFQWVKEDLGAADMNDIVLRTGLEDLPTCVLTLAQNFGTGRTFDSLIQAEVTVLGKVSGVWQQGSGVNLLRRSILGYLPQDQSEKIFSDLRNDAMFGHLVEELVIEPPIVQILPLAVFV